MNIKSSTKGKSGRLPRLGSPVETAETVPIQMFAPDPQIERLMKMNELLDEMKRKADEANNAIVGLVKVITAFHL